MDWKSLVDLLKGHNVFIQTHNFPDPDALASALGLQVFLREQGVPSKICYVGDIEKLTTKRMLDVFPLELASKEELDQMTIEDYIVTVDGQKYNSNFTDLPGDEVACIDHHPTIKECEDYHYRDIRIVGACASLVTQYFVESHTPMTSIVATALIYGILMDTDSFKRGVTKLDIEMFGYLNEYADKDLLCSLRNSVMELKDLRAYGEAIQNVHIYGNIGFASVSFECPEALVAMISDFVLGLDVVDISIVYARRANGLKFSVRSELSDIHAGALIRTALDGYGDGGGHAMMAGGYMPDEVIETFNKQTLAYEIEQLFLNAIAL